MNLYEFQKSRLFIDLYLKSLRFNIFKFLFLEAIFHVEPIWDKRMKLSTNGLCHMTKAAAMLIYAKRTFKIFFSGTERPTNWNLVCSIEYSSTTKFIQMWNRKADELKLGMQHWVLKYHQVYSNDAPGLTLTYFTARLNLVRYAFVWKKVKTMAFFQTLL